MKLSYHLIIGWHLLRREWQVFVQSWTSTAIDAVIVSCIFALSIGYFMPAMGMPAVMRLPVFLGTIIVFCVSEGYATGLNVALDLTGNKIFAYHASLPITLPIVAITYVLGVIMRIILVATPVSMLGLTILGEWGHLSVSVGKLLVITLLGALFWALLFLTVAVWCRTKTMLGDIWARLIAPMFCFGCTFFPWGAIYRTAPRVAKFLLINPMTHCVEGLRSALLGGNHYVSFALSGVVLSVYCIALCFSFYYALRKRLNVVTERRV